MPQEILEESGVPCAAADFILPENVITVSPSPHRGLGEAASIFSTKLKSAAADGTQKYKRLQCQALSDFRRPKRLQCQALSDFKRRKFIRTGAVFHTWPTGGDRTQEEIPLASFLNPQPSTLKP